jgi:hypothetical protein
LLQVSEAAMSKSGYQAAEGGVIPRLFHFQALDQTARRRAEQGSSRNDGPKKAMRSNSLTRVDLTAKVFSKLGISVPLSPGRRTVVQHALFFGAVMRFE